MSILSRIVQLMKDLDGIRYKLHAIKEELDAEINGKEDKGEDISEYLQRINEFTDGFDGEGG